MSGPACRTWPDAGSDAAGAFDDEDPGLGCGVGDVLVAGLGVADAPGDQVLDVLHAAGAVVHVDGAVEDDEDLGPVVDVPGAGVISVQCRRTVALSMAVMPSAPRARSAVQVVASMERAVFPC